MNIFPLPGCRSAVLMLLICLSTLASAVEATFFIQPSDVTVVAGHQAHFILGTSTIVESTRRVQWYRNGVAVGASSANMEYTFTATTADQGAKYHATVSGKDKSDNNVGPTATVQATLTVLPAGTSYPPAITAPDANVVLQQPEGANFNYPTFRAAGNYLAWSYRYSHEPANQWHELSASYTGLQVISDLAVQPPRPCPHTVSMTVRVTDDAGVSASRTWSINNPNHPPEVETNGGSPLYGPPFFVVCIGQTLHVDAAHGLARHASDQDLDPLTFRIDSTKPHYPGLTIHPDGSFDFTPDASLRPATWSPAILGAPIPATFRVGSFIANDGVADSGSSPLYIAFMTGPGDINRDGVVNADDLQAVLDHLGESGTIPPLAP